MRLVVTAYVVAFIGPLLLGTSGVGITRADSALARIGRTVGVRVSDHREEQMLVDHFGDAYRTYAARTWRLLPFVW